MAKKPKIIFTADDYGCADEIDDGILKAVDDGLIKSVAAFANGPDVVNRLKKIKVRQDRGDVEVGCHLTITSGKPLTDLTWFNDNNGNFRSFTEMKRKGTFSEDIQDEVKKDLKEELLAQIEILEKNGITVKHLSSHHNALVFFEEYLEVFIEVAREKKIKMRSPIITPTLKNKLFITQLRVRSADNLDLFDIMELKRFSRRIPRWLAKYKKKNNVNNDFPEMPDCIDGRHYGPIPVLKPKKSKYEAKAKRKTKKMMKAINKLSPKSVVEYVYHLALLDNITKPFNMRDYAGVNKSYFDSREIEFLSLSKYLKAENVKLASWGDDM
ncbi:MAG: ChbG/HpnK family deacetylase [Cyclobacteriaceae bacterium]|nr:ChbG/HpnK family deacetylase [Cyclobacteriaceae bacterium]